MSRIAIVSGVFALGALSTLVGACGLRVSSTVGADSGASSPPGSVCTPGQSSSCVCAGGESGEQVCAPGGGGFEPCACTSPGPGPDPGPPAPTPPTPTPPPTPTWPSPPTNPAPPSAKSITFAVHAVHLGDELDSTGNPDWYRYGYNLDGKTTIAASMDVCTLPNNGNTKNQQDAPGGVDNSFGENIVPLLGAVAPNPSVTANKAFALGTRGWILSVLGLSADPAQSAVGLTGEFFLGAPFGEPPNSPSAVPTFTLADDWPVDRTMVTSPVGANGLLVSPPVSVSEFPKAYVVGGEFVSGISEPLDLVISLGGVPLALTLRHAVITFNHPTATHASGGVIAGVLATSDFVAAVQKVAGNISTSLCTGSSFAQIAKTITQASDIMVDGTNAPGVPCNAISVGIGFDADEILDPQHAGDVPPPISPCADGG